VLFAVDFEADVESAVFDEEDGEDFVEFIVEDPVWWVFSWFKLLHYIQHKVTVNFIGPFEVYLSLPDFSKLSLTNMTAGFFVTLFFLFLNGVNWVIWVFDVKEILKGDQEFVVGKLCENF